MHVNIQSKDVKITKSLRGYIGKKLERIKFYSDKIIDAHIIITKTKREVMAEVTLMLERKVFRCAEKATSLSEAIDFVIDKIERKLRKTKEMLKDHKHPSVTEVSELLALETEMAHEEGVDEVHMEVFPVAPKPMDNLEATLQMQVEGKPYFAYFPIEKNVDMLNVVVGKHPVFLIKKGDNGAFKQYIYHEGGKSVLAKVFGQKEGWYRNDIVIEEGKGLKTLDKKPMTVDEYNVSAASRELQASESDNFLLYRNNMTGRVEGIFKERNNRFSILRH